MRAVVGGPVGGRGLMDDISGMESSTFCLSSYWVWEALTPWRTSVSKTMFASAVRRHEQHSARSRTEQFRLTGACVQRDVQTREPSPPDAWGPLTRGAVGRG